MPRMNVCKGKQTPMDGINYFNNTSPCVVYAQTITGKLQPEEGGGGSSKRESNKTSVEKDTMICNLCLVQLADYQGK